MGPAWNRRWPTAMHPNDGCLRLMKSLQAALLILCEPTLHRPVRRPIFKTELRCGRGKMCQPLFGSFPSSGHTVYKWWKKAPNGWDPVVGLLWLILTSISSGGVQRLDIGVKVCRFIAGMIFLRLYNNLDKMKRNPYLSADKILGKYGKSKWEIACLS